MRRRGFLSSLVAFVVAPFVPTPKPLTPVRIAWERQEAWRSLPVGPHNGALRVGDVITIKCPKLFQDPPSDWTERTFTIGAVVS